MKNAFTYMFKVEKFWLKALIYFLLTFLANLSTNYAQLLLPTCRSCSLNIPPQYWVFLLLGTVLSIFPLGYIFSCIKALIPDSETYSIPFLNPLKDFVKGFKYSIAILLLLIPAYLVIFLIILGVSAVLQSNPELGRIVSKVIYKLAQLFILLLVTGFNRLFAENNSFLNFYRFKQIFELISANVKKYLLYVLLIGVVYILNILIPTGCGQIAGMLKMSTNTGLIVLGMISAAIGTYAIFVICYLTAKIGSGVNTEENKETETAE